MWGRGPSGHLGRARLGEPAARVQGLRPLPGGRALQPRGPPPLPPGTGVRRPEPPSQVPARAAPLRCRWSGDVTPRVPEQPPPPPRSPGTCGSSGPAPPLPRRARLPPPLALTSSGLASLLFISASGSPADGCDGRRRRGPPAGCSECPRPGGPPLASRRREAPPRRSP